MEKRDADRGNDGVVRGGEGGYFDGSNFYFDQDGRFHEFQYTDNDLTGPLTHTISWAALKSIEGTTPKVCVVTKAAITGSAEINSLRGRIRELEGENRDLVEWVEKRKYVDEHVGVFSLGELTKKVRDTGLTVGGTKVQLMM